jgi:hypothetical protein
MSSSRDQMSFTGVPGMLLAIATVWMMRSRSSLRPNPPPMNCGWMRTCSGFTPPTSAAAPCAPCGNCVLIQTSTPVRPHARDTVLRLECRVREHLHRVHSFHGLPLA